MIASGNVAGTACDAKDKAVASDESALAAAAATKASSPSNSSTASDPNNCCTRWLQKLVTVLKWVFNDFRMRHLVWIKFIFFFQSASMTVLYPFLNLHMKSLGISIQETAIINAVIPVCTIVIMIIIIIIMIILIMIIVIMIIIIMIIIIMIIIIMIIIIISL